MQKVIVYSTPTCPYCNLLKEFLKEKKVAFKEIDVSQDHGAAKEMIEKTGQIGVPVTIIGKEVIVGFDKQAIEKALKKK